MKSIKEKAEAYDKVLEWATEAHKVCDGMLKEDLEHLFPELKESEDERIRKAIINVFATHKDYEIFFCVSVEDILAWLEAQGEQKPAWSEEDKVMLDKVIERLHKHSAGDKEYLDIYYWLIALKDRVQPQPKQEWKPSDEQMLALDSAIHCYAGISPTNNREVYALEIMKEQLKKLRDE